jgi:hypothetical protein
MYVLGEPAVSGSDFSIKCENAWQQEVSQLSPASAATSSDHHNFIHWDQHPQFSVNNSSSIWSPVSSSPVMHQSHHEARTYASLYPPPHHSQVRKMML